MDAARIEEVVGEFVNLKKRGVNYIGLCPFHDEKTPSFSVSATKGIFKCFGCGKGGNAVNFLMEHEHFSYPEALKFLANKYSIHIEETTPGPEEQEAHDEKESLFNISNFAQNFFSEQLLNSEEGKAIALTYFKERGFTVETIKKFGLGYCPNKWDEFTKHALKNGYKKELLLKTSLSKSKDSSLYDTFRARVVFPIHNLSGRVLGFGARILTSDKNKPKYLNSAESEIYQKSKVLYGLFFAKSEIIKDDNCYIVEGYTDVISMQQAGIENVISSSGTSLTTEQIKLLRRYTKNITLLFDSDAAGIKAAFRSIDMILEEGMNVKLVLFPEGEDPDSYANKNRPADVKEFLRNNEVDFITFKTNLLLSETKDDPIKKATLIKEIANTISLIPEPIARTLYVQKCSKQMNIEEKILFSEINKLRRKKNKETLDKKQQEDIPEAYIEDLSYYEKLVQTPLSSTFQEKEILRILLQYGNEEIGFAVKDENNVETEEKVKIKDFLIDDILNDDISFDDATCQKMFEDIVEARDENTKYLEKHFFHHDNETIKKLAIDLLTNPYSISENWEKVHSIYVKTENDLLKDITMGVLHAFKLKKVEKVIFESEEELKTLKDNEKITKCLEKLNKFKQLRYLLSKELSRVVTK